MNNKKKISIVIPIYNESENIKLLYDEVEKSFASEQKKYDVEYVFTDNSSSDGSFDLIKKLAKEDKRIKAYRFSRNFGYQLSIYTGYTLCTGDAAIQLDADLQDPPELISDFLRLWEQGYSVVYGVRRSRKEKQIITIARKIFYRLISNISEYPLPIDSGDFRLVDKKILNQLKSIKDKNIYLRGCIAEMGFRQIGVEYNRNIRVNGKSKFNLKNLFKIAADGIFNHSMVPLRISSLIGFIGITISFMLSISVLIAYILYGDEWPRGYASLLLAIIVSMSINCIMIGILGEYIGRMYKNQNSTPLVIIEESIS